MGESKSLNDKIKKFDEISERMRDDIYAKVLAHYKKNPNSPWSGKSLVMLENSIKSFYAKMGEEYQECFRDTLPEYMQEFYDRAQKELKTAGLERAIIGEVDATRIENFLDSSFDHVAMRTQRMSVQHVQALRNLSADVLRQMSITGGTRREISKAMLDRAMQIKDFEFIDKRGSKWTSKSYFNMLARTELMNAGRASYDDKVTGEGFDIMKLSTSGNACDKCAKYEGKLFSLTGNAQDLPSKATLEADGVFHPNCTHSYSVVPKYIINRDYNADGTRKNSR